MYFLRYAAGTPIKDRLHAHTLGRHETIAGAYDALEGTPEPWRSKLEVVSR